jgi:hypothetical protein
MAEGVGFEPTVGCPTLDFESSALNRTQPPFLKCRRKRRTPNVQHSMSNANTCKVVSVLRTILSWEMAVLLTAFGWGCASMGEWRFFLCLADLIVRLAGKKCYNFSLATPSPGAAYCMSQGQPTLLLVVHQDSQLVCAAVHNYSHLIENSTPPSSP